VATQAVHTTPTRCGSKCNHAQAVLHRLFVALTQHCMFCIRVHRLLRLSCGLELKQFRSCGNGRMLRMLRKRNSFCNLWPHRRFSQRQDRRFGTPKFSVNIVRACSLRSRRGGCLNVRAGGSSALRQCAVAYIRYVSCTPFAPTTPFLQSCMM
jgi:hypothetical protein